MKRYPELQDLSREHHDALKLALHLKRVVASGDLIEIETACLLARRVFEQRLLPHFEEEEGTLLPALLSYGGGDVRFAPDALLASELVERTLADHRTIKSLLQQLAVSDAEKLLQFAELLMEHVRFEERELFVEAERLIDQNTLARVMSRKVGTDGA